MPHLLEGLVVPTPWGPRTIQVVSVSRDPALETVSYSFVEDPAVRYHLRIAPDLLRTHALELPALVSRWTLAGHPNGSDQSVTGLAERSAQVAPDDA